MDETITKLSLVVLTRLKEQELVSPQARILVGICGIPASGKTSLALQVVARINYIHQSATVTQRPVPLDIDSHNDHDERTVSPTNDLIDVADVAICVSQDGWHLPRSALDQFDDPQHAHDRRGAAFTFDGVAFSSFVLALCASPCSTPPFAPVQVAAASGSRPKTVPTTTSGGGGGCSGIILAPSFSHTLKDPAPDAILIYPHHRVVVIEGLYTFLRIAPWDAAARVLDERWFVDVDPVEARERLVRRHILTGVAKDREEAEWRADNNDIPNGHFIRENMLEPTQIVMSMYDPAFASHGRTE